MTPGDLEALEDEALIDRHLDGHPRAFAVLDRRWRGKLTAWIRGKIPRSERAEDLAQETFIRVYRHLHRFDTSRTFSTWVYTIASNLAKNELRNEGRSPLRTFSRYERDEPDARPLRWKDETYGPDRLYEKRSLRTAVEEAILELKPIWRKPVVLREIEGRTYKQIADILRLPLGTVKSRLKRGRDRFMELLEAEGVEAP